MAAVKTRQDSVGGKVFDRTANVVMDRMEVFAEHGWRCLREKLHDWLVC